MGSFQSGRQVGSLVGSDFGCEAEWMEARRAQLDIHACIHQYIIGGVSLVRWRCDPGAQAQEQVGA